MQLKNKAAVTALSIMKTSRSVYSGLKPRGAAEWFLRPDKTHAASFFERLQKHSWKI